MKMRCLKSCDRGRGEVSHIVCNPGWFHLLLVVSIAEKSWKRMVTKVTYVGEGFTRKPPKYERFIRPMALRFKKAHVTHPEARRSNF